MDYIISEISADAVLKSHFKNGKVVIYNRMLKRSIPEIVAAFGETSETLITYYYKNKTNYSFELVLDVWSKNDFEECEAIAARLCEIVSVSIDNYLFETQITNQIGDEDYYRLNIFVPAKIL